MFLDELLKCSSFIDCKPDDSNANDFSTLQKCPQKYRVMKGTYRTSLGVVACRIVTVSVTSIAKMSFFLFIHTLFFSVPFHRYEWCQAWCGYTPIGMSVHVYRGRTETVQAWEVDVNFLDRRNFSVDFDLHSGTATLVMSLLHRLASGLVHRPSSGRTPMTFLSLGNLYST